MTETAHAELDRICTEICDKLCHWPWVMKDQQKMDDRCASCQVLFDLANLAEKLEARVPPEEGEPVWIVRCDCDNCPHEVETAYLNCADCRLFVAAQEPFSAADHLDDFYHRRAFRSKEEAEKLAESWRG